MSDIFNRCPVCERLVRVRKSDHKLGFHNIKGWPCRGGGEQAPHFCPGKKTSHDSIKGWRTGEPEEESHMEDDPDYKEDYCRHPSHEPPGHMVIPAGKRYVHICPGCGMRIVLRSSSVMF